MRTRRPKQRRHGWRWIFAILVVVSIVILAVAIRSFLIEASMTLGGLGAPSSGTLTSMIVNRRDYVPPTDSLLTPTQIAFLLRVVEIDDSLRREKSEDAVFRTMMAQQFNAHVMSPSEYTWITAHAEITIAAARDFGLIDFGALTPAASRVLDRCLSVEWVSTKVPERLRIEADRLRIAAPLLIRRMHAGSHLFPQLSYKPYGTRNPPVTTEPSA